MARPSGPNRRKRSAAREGSSPEGSRATVSALTGRVQQADELVFGDRTCWLLGAGASYDSRGDGEFAVPLTAQLLEGQSERGDAITSMILELLADGSGEALDSHTVLASDLSETFERVRRACDGTGPTAVRAREVFRRCVCYLSESVSQADLDSSLEASEAYNARNASTWPRVITYNYMDLGVFCTMFPTASVITLNYDYALDRCLELMCSEKNDGDSGAVPAQYLAWVKSLETILSGRRPDAGAAEALYIKLHGTLHLFSCTNSGCRLFGVLQNSGPVRRWPFSRILHSGSECATCGGATRPVIQVPGETANPGESNYTEFVYAAARERLSRASVWLIVGYSWPSYDKDVRALLHQASLSAPRAGDERRIYVVSPDAMEVGARIAQDLDQVIEAIPHGLSDLLTFARGMSVEEFLNRTYVPSRDAGISWPP
jgi:hypothetical protein